MDKSSLLMIATNSDRDRLHSTIFVKDLNTPMPFKNTGKLFFVFGTYCLTGRLSHRGSEAAIGSETEHLWRISYRKLVFLTACRRSGKPLRFLHLSYSAS
jgi:hypothetical protein